MSAADPRPQVSFVVVNWNAGTYLPNFFSSLQSVSAGFSYELVLVDNGSTDGSLEYVKTHHPWVRVMETGRNLGFAGGNNLGIQEASGKYLCLVNPDVVFLSGCMDTVLEALESNPRAGIVGPRVYGKDGKLQRSVRRFPSLGNTAAKAFGLDSKLFDPYRHMSRITEVEVMNGCFWLVRREALEDVGLLDERFFMYSEDMDWCRRFRNAGWKVLCVPEPLLIHFGGGSSALAPVRFYLEMRRANLQYWRKHHPETEQRLFVLLSLLHQGIRYLAWTFLCIIPSPASGGAAYKRMRSLRAIDWLLTGSARTEEPVDPSFYEPGHHLPALKRAR